MRLEPLADGVYRVFIGEMDSFSVYGASGGLVSRRIGYLVKKGEGEMPESLHGDLGLPRHAEPFRIFEHERGWKHAAFWFYDYSILDCRIANDDEKAAAEALLNA
jgi:hypothetical protein